MKKSHDEFQQENELNGCNEKSCSKTDPQVSGKRLCRWIMKHGKRTNFDENWFGFEILKRIINENTGKNTKRKNEQERCLILFCENKMETLLLVAFHIYSMINQPPVDPENPLNYSITIDGFDYYSDANRRANLRFE